MRLVGQAYGINRSFNVSNVAHRLLHSEYSDTTGAQLADEFIAEGFADDV